AKRWTNMCSCSRSSLMTPITRSGTWTMSRVCRRSSINRTIWQKRRLQLRPLSRTGSTRR
ncbi:hypothetical protein AAVH_42305, partial [Aphelenchoides avenae]